MPSARIVLALAATSICMTFAGCATTHGNLAGSADRLERNADQLARNARGDMSARNASELADEAHEFRRTLNDRDADDRDVRNAFEDLSRDYHALRDSVDRSDTRETQLDLRPVTEAYLDVEREMNRSSSVDSRRYARDRDIRDR
jgi:hypothetical protein